METTLKSQSSEVLEELRRIYSVIFYDGELAEVIICINCGVITLAGILKDQESKCTGCSSGETVFIRAVWKSSLGQWELLN